MTDSTRLIALSFAALLVGAFLGVGAVTTSGDEIRAGVGNGTSTATGAQTTTAENSTVTVVNTTDANVTFACDFVRVSVPGERSYALVVHYVDTASGLRSRASLGPLVGTVEEPYDEEIVFVEVQVLIGSRVVASAFIPEGCPGAKWM